MGSFGIGSRPEHENAHNRFAREYAPEDAPRTVLLYAPDVFGLDAAIENRMTLDRRLNQLAALAGIELTDERIEGAAKLATKLVKQHYVDAGSLMREELLSIAFLVHWKSFRRPIVSDGWLRLKLRADGYSESEVGAAISPLSFASTGVGTREIREASPTKSAAPIRRATADESAGRNTFQRPFDGSEAA